MYAAIDKIYFASRYASIQYDGKAITLDQLKGCITAMTHIIDPNTMKHYVELATKNFSPTATPQFKKLDQDSYLPTPNRPKKPNTIIAQAYEEKEKREGPHP
jgi:hypothetical protein